VCGFVTPPRRASVKLSDRDGQPLGQRILEAKSCAELSDALVLALSLMLDFSRQDVDALRAQAQTTKANDTEAKPAQSVTADETSAPAPQVEATTWRPRFVVDGRLGIGFAPAPSFGFGVAAGIGAPEGPLLELNAGYWLAQQVDGFEGSAKLQLWEIGAAACPQLGTPKAQLCALVQGGMAHARGSEFPMNQASNTGLLRAGLELRSLWPLGPTFVEARAAATGALMGYRVLLTDTAGAHELFQSGKVFVSAALGYGFFLP
jgi:hypothetical protein